MQTLNILQLRALSALQQVPFKVRFSEANDKLVVECTEILRFLPGRRLVCKALWEGRPLLFKLFLHKHKAKRDYRHEQYGHNALTRAAVRTPAQVLAGQLPLCGYYIAYDYIENSHTYASIYKYLQPEQRLILNNACVDMLDRLHKIGFAQVDMHLDNILVTGESHEVAYMLDAGEVRKLPRLGQNRAKISNLAKYLAQLPSDEDDSLAPCLTSYQANQQVNLKHLDQAVSKWRDWRIRKYLKKSGRNSSEFRASKTWDEFRVVRKPYMSSELEELLAIPERAMAQGELLKDGNTATVVSCQAGDKPVIIKRYNIKSWQHALSRFWRPSRAWHSWQSGLMLETIGIHTPAPIAVIEKRTGPFRKQAYLVMESMAQLPDAMSEYVDARELSASQLDGFNRLFKGLCRCRISHGDMKATNFLVSPERVLMIDLDSMQQHRSNFIYRWALNRDLRRFMRNWQVNPDIRRQFAEQLLLLGRDSVCSLTPDRIKKITDNA